RHHRGNPALQAFAAILVSPNVAAHSIIAVDGNGPIETGDGGVVTDQSAHIDEAVSELVVRSDHSVQANQHTVSEVRRILRLHLAEACPRGCAPVVTNTPAIAAAARLELRPSRDDTGRFGICSAPRRWLASWSPLP